MINMKTQGFVLLDVDVVALNNAGKNTTSNFDNAVATKRIRKNGRSYVYVSGQAWRFWWREALQKNLNWDLSPITREAKIAFTNANPIKYADDDVFGYMKAASEEIEEKGKTKKVNITVTRVSPLKNSAIVSVSSVTPEENWSSMARQEGDSVPYAKQEYSAIMKGMFSLDLEMVGTFSSYNKTGFLNLSEVLRKEAIDNGAMEIDDSFMKNGKGEPLKLIRLDKATRIKRATDTIKALKNISGGAMQTSNMGDVTPKFIILATTNTGNHPFSHVASNSGSRDEFANLNIDNIREIINDYLADFQGKLFIGKRAGFMDEKNEDLQQLAAEFTDLVVLTTVNKAIDRYSIQLENQIS